jgi:hypothetical protein
LEIRFLDDDTTRALVGASGRVSVRRLLRANRATNGDRVMVVTTRDLELRGCARLFGYADRRRAAGVVSTFHLGTDGEDRVAARLANVIEHERGHLEGLHHCGTAECVMHPARATGDLDVRSLSRCERCREPRRSWRARLIAAVLCVLAFAAVQSAAGLVKVKKPPFTVYGGSEGAAVFYRQQAVLALADTAEARATADRLNDLFAQISPAPIEAVAGGPGALLRTGGVTLAPIDRRRTRDSDPLVYAQAWAARMNWLMRAKGTEAEGCPDCHIRRLAEVEEAARVRRQRRW